MPRIPLPTNLGRKTPNNPQHAPGTLPEADEPVMHYEEGTNQAWRGIEQHGVPANGNSTAYDPGVHNADTGDITSYIPESDDVEPVPVRIVALAKGERKRHRASSQPVTTTARIIVPQHDKRRTVKIHNPASTTVNSSNAPPADLNQTQTNVTVTGNSAEFTIPATGWSSIGYILNVTANAGATPNWTVAIQETMNGTDWVTTTVLGAAITATGVFRATSVGATSSRQRVLWTLNSGTSTGFTFTVQAFRFPVTPNQTVTGAAVYLGPDSNVNPIMNYKLEAGQDVSMAVDEAVYAVCDTGGSATVYVLDEYSVDI